MLGTYFYHEVLRKTVVAFGTLFNDIHIQHEDRQGGVISDTKVPLAYGPRSKFLAKIRQQQELAKAVAITLPRMSFEMTGLQYDPARKTSVTRSFKAVDGDNVKKVFLPVPYNVNFELNILCKLNEDALQIVEQILPFFQPSFNVSLDLIESIGEKRDIPVVLENISFTDEYEGDFSTRRVLTYTLILQQRPTCSVPLQKAPTVSFARFRSITTQIPTGNCEDALHCCSRSNQRRSWRRLWIWSLQKCSSMPRTTVPLEVLMYER